MPNLVLVLVFQRSAGDQQKIFKRLSESHVHIENKNPRNAAAACEVICQVSRHRLAIVGDENAIVHLAPVEQDRIG